MTPPQPIKPAKSVTKGVAAQDTRAFSSFDDLAAWAVSLGLAASVAEVRSSKLELWGDLLFRWYTQGQVACVFAQSLARDPAKGRWLSAVVEGVWTPDLVTGMVDAAGESGAEGLQLLFPGPATAEQAIDLIQRLCSHSRWDCAENAWLEGESGDSVQIGLRWLSPGSKYESWVLGIAPFEPMPFTRRFVGAPFIALVLRPTEPIAKRAGVPKGPSGLDASHLAHMDDGLGTDEAKREKWKAGTGQAKRALISPEPMSRARAKVTFALPAWARDALKDVL